MKSFFKKIALVLVLAMVVTMLPAKVASAASLDENGLYMRSKLTLFLNGDASGTIGDFGYATVKYDKATYSVSFASSNPEVATVGPKKGGVTAVAVGETTVTATFTAEDGTTLEKKCKVSVKQNAKEVWLHEKSEGSLLELTAGDELQLVVLRNAKDETVPVARNQKGAITDGIRFASSNEDVFTVGPKKGGVKAVGEGEAYLYVWAVEGQKQNGGVDDGNPYIVEYKDGKIEKDDPCYEDYKYLRTTEVKKYEVKVAAADPVVTGVTVKSVTEIELAVIGVTNENVGTLKITNANNGEITALFSQPKLSEDGKTVTVTKYINLINDEELTFAFGDDKGFTYTVKVGEAEGIIIDEPETVIAGVDTNIKYRVVDANGIDLGITNVSFEVNDYTYASVDNENAKITMWQVGTSVTLTAKYDTGKWDDNWNKIIKENSIVVTCIEESAVTASSVSYKVDLSWNNGNDLSTKPASLFEDVFVKRLFVEFVLSNGAKVNSDAATSSFTFETLTPEVLLVEANTGYLTPVKKGTARILVKYNDGAGLSTTTVATVEVISASALDHIGVNKNNVELTNSTEIGDFVEMTVTGTDQYGGNYPLTGSLGKEALAWPSEVAGSDRAAKKAKAETYFILDSTTATFNASGVPAGTYTYRITYGDKNVIVNIRVKQPVTDSNGKYVITSYKIYTNNVESKEIKPSDLVDGGSVNLNPAKITFKIVGVDRNGVAATVETDSTKLANVKLKAGNTEFEPDKESFGETGDIVAEFVTARTAATPVTGSALIIDGDGYDVRTGAFVISATYDGRTVIPATVSVSLKDISVPTIKEVTSSVISGDDVTVSTYKAKILDKIVLNDANKYLSIDPSSYNILLDIASPIDQAVSEGKSAEGMSYVVVKSIKVYERMGDVLVLHTVSVNRHFSVTIKNN